MSSTSRSLKTLEAAFLSFDESLAVRGYRTLMESPDVASAVEVIADIVSNATIHLMRNTPNGDIRVRNELSKFMDIHPYSLGTRAAFISWIVTNLVTQGNAFVLPVYRSGYLDDLIPMPDACPVALDGGARYEVHWNARVFAPDEVLHFVTRPDPKLPWMGRGIKLQLRDVLKNLRQSAATTNSFLSDKWKPSCVVKVDALSDEFSGPAGRRKLLEEYIDGQEAGEPWVIPADLMDVVQMKPLSLADLAISDNVELDKRAVAAAFGVPPFLIGVGDYDQDEYNNFIRRKITPLANGIAQELTRKLLISPDMYFRISDRKLYAYSLTELAQVADDQYIRGLMTGNEARDWLNLPPLDGLDELVILENYIPRGMIAEQKKLTQEE